MPTSKGRSAGLDLASRAEVTDMLVPREPLKRWLAGQMPVDDDFSIERISAGHSNEMFRIISGDNQWVLRRPPRVGLSTSAHSMIREHRVLRALRDSAIPHPQVLAACEDPDIIGAPFLIQAFVDGFAPVLPLPEPFTSDVNAQRQMAFSMVDTLVDLAQFDWTEAGLEGFGKPEGFLNRQVGRWLGQLSRYQSRELPWLSQIAEWLNRNQPENPPIGLLHGDYTWSNVMFAPDRPGRVAAVVDWEQSTIGDPLLDLGWLLGLWQEDGEETHGRDPRTMFCQLPGNATRAELLARYAEKSPLPVDHIDYYQVLALFKLACIIEGSWYRYSTGVTDDPTHATFEQRVPALLTRAARIAGVGE